MKHLFALASCALVLAAPAMAQQVAATGPADQVANQVDREFVETAASSGLVEVNDARIAEQQAPGEAICPPDNHRSRQGQRAADGARQPGRPQSAGATRCQAESHRQPAEDAERRRLRSRL